MDTFKNSKIILGYLKNFEPNFMCFNHLLLRINFKLYIHIRIKFFYFQKIIRYIESIFPFF